MKPTDAIFVDSLERRAADISATLSRWLKAVRIPVDVPANAHNALQDLRNAAPQVVPNVCQAVIAEGSDADALTLAALDSCIDALHTLIGVLPTDTRAFSVVDDLMGLRDEVEARFTDARRRLAVVSQQEVAHELAATIAERSRF